MDDLPSGVVLDLERKPVGRVDAAPPVRDRGELPGPHSVLCGGAHFQGGFNDAGDVAAPCSFCGLDARKKTAGPTR
jgi:hypothetical protein